MMQRLIRCFQGALRGELSAAGGGRRCMASTSEWTSSQVGVLEFLDPEGGAASGKTGRSWSASEMRLKSTEDLRRLWFVLLREKAVLETEKQWCITNGRHWEGGRANYRKVRQSMARLKAVMGERTRLYQEAKKFVKFDENYRKLLELQTDTSSTNFPLADPVMEEIIRWEFSKIGQRRRNRIISEQLKWKEDLEKQRRRRREAWLTKQRAPDEDEAFGVHPLEEAFNHSRSRRSPVR